MKLKTGMRFLDAYDGETYELGSNIRGMMWPLANLTTGEYVAPVKEEHIQFWIMGGVFVSVDERLLRSPKFEEIQEPDWMLNGETLRWDEKGRYPFENIRSYFR